MGYAWPIPLLARPFTCPALHVCVALAAVAHGGDDPLNGHGEGVVQERVRVAIAQALENERCGCSRTQSVRERRNERRHAPTAGLGLGGPEATRARTRRTRGDAPSNDGARMGDAPSNDGARTGDARSNDEATHLAQC